MTHPSKIKGTSFERAVVDYLRTHGHPYAERAYGAGRPDDCGDINGIPGVVLECKNHNRLQLAAWMDELDVERRNARAWYGALIVKRTRRPTSDAYVVMSLEQFAELLADSETT